MRKGFVRSLELVLVIVLVFGIFMIVSSQIFRVTTSLKANPSRVTGSLLETMSPYLQKNVENYDLSSGESLLNYNLIENNIVERTVLEYDSFLGSFSTNVEHVVTYNFPEGVDPNSIQLRSQESTYVRNVKWNWFRIPITIKSEEIIGGNLFLQVEVPLDTREDTFVFYYDNKKMSIDINKFETTNNTGFVSFVVNIPEIKEENQAYLYFSPDSPYKSDYSSLTGSIIRNLTIGKMERAPRADIIFKPTKSDVYIKYSLGSANINSYNSSMVSENYKKIDDSLLKGGKAPIRTRTLPRSYFSSEKVLWIGDQKAVIRVYSWYI